MAGRNGKHDDKVKVLKDMSNAPPDETLERLLALIPPEMYVAQLEQTKQRQQEQLAQMVADIRAHQLAYQDKADREDVPHIEIPEALKAIRRCECYDCVQKILLVKATVVRKGIERTQREIAALQNKQAQDHAEAVAEVGA